MAQRALDGPAADAGERGDHVDRQDAGPGALALAADDREDGGLALGEGGGDPGRDDPARGLTAATLDARLPIGRSRRASGGPGMAKDGLWRLCAMSRAAKEARRACTASLMAPAAASSRRPSPWARQVRRATSSAAWVFGAARAAAWN